MVLHIVCVQFKLCMAFVYFELIDCFWQDFPYFKAANQKLLIKWKQSKFINKYFIVIFQHSLPASLYTFCSALATCLRQREYIFAQSLDSHLPAPLEGLSSQGLASQIRFHLRKQEKSPHGPGPVNSAGGQLFWWLCQQWTVSQRRQCAQVRCPSGGTTPG